MDPGAILSNPVSCPICLREFEAVLFDPPVPDVAVPRVAEAGPEGANPCGHHPGNVAADHCTRCGVFMCALCRIETDGRVLCPPCFERLLDAGQLPSLVAHHHDYGHMQLLLAILGLSVKQLVQLDRVESDRVVLRQMIDSGSAWARWAAAGLTTMRFRCTKIPASWTRSRSVAPPGAGESSYDTRMG